MFINILDHRNQLPTRAVLSRVSMNQVSSIELSKLIFIPFQHTSVHWFGMVSLQLVLWGLPNDSKMLRSKTMLKIKAKPFIFLLKRKFIKVITGTDLEKYFWTLLLALLQMSPFSPLGPSPLNPGPLWLSPRCCLCLWVRDVYSVASPFPFSPPSPKPLPSGWHWSDLCIWECTSVCR